MLIRIASFVLETFFFVLIASALMRCWMNFCRVNMQAQPGNFVMAVTDWLVKPLRRALPKAWAQAKVDVASLLAAALLALAYGLVWGAVFGVLLGGMSWATFSPAFLLSLLALALKMLLRVALQSMMILVFGLAILSWVQPGSPAYALLARLTEPWLAPLRRIIPSIGGVDLSAIALILALQIALMVLV